MPPRIYLDNAATSWPKNERAIQAAWDFMLHCGATAGRGSYASSQIADRWLLEARRNLAKLVGASEANSIAFCSSGTHSLNAALMGVLRPGDHVIASELEHNSLLRPLSLLSRDAQIEVDFAKCDHRGTASLDHASSLVRSSTKLIALGHASNVTGTVQSIEPWRSLADRCGALLLVDASQTLGYIPVDVSKTRIDLLAAAGHKGLRALPGTGFLYVDSKLHADFRPLMTGGTGSQSESIDVPATWPQVVEVGNYNLPGIISMSVASASMNSQIDQTERSRQIDWQHCWREPFERLVDGLRRLAEVRLIGYDLSNSEASVQRIPLVSVTAPKWSVHDLAMVLDTSFGIEVRAGYHCSALIHRALGSTEGGTLRLSPGHSTTIEQIDQVLDALQQILQSPQ